MSTVDPLDAEATLRELYALLPAIHRARDAQPDGADGPLRALLRVVAGQLAVVSDEVDRLYANAFIETCEDWVVPYIGDLVGYHPLADVPNVVASPRVDVANTLAYRRRKGTATVLERLARDVSGWPAVAVEFFRTLATTERLAHVRSRPPFTADVRNALRASSAGGPFDRNAHLAEVRRIASGRGRYGIANVGVFVWRLGAVAVRRAEAQRILAGGYTFDPVGRSLPLLNAPRAFADELAAAKPENLPLPIGRRALGEELAAFTKALAAGESTARDNLRLLASFTVYDATGTAIAPEHVQVADLSAWDQPAGRLPLPAGVQAFVDPVLGRIDLGGAPADAARTVLVDYALASPGPYGAAPYTRTHATNASHAIVRDPATSQPSESLQAAYPTALANGTAVGGQVYAVLEYAASIGERAAATAIALATGQHLTIRAATHERAVLSGSLDVTVNGSGTASLHLEGLLLDGGLTVSGTGSLQLTVTSCTVRARGGAAAIAWPKPGGASAPAGTLTVASTLSGPVRVGLDTSVRVAVRDALVDGYGGSALTAPIVDVLRATLLGPLDAHEIGTIENAIVTGAVTSARTQAGCCRYSYVTRGSRAPHRFRCQPEDAVSAATDAAARANPALTPAQLAAIGDAAAARCVPVFDAVGDGDPGYGRLSRWCPPEIRTGAEDGAEMGVFHDLYQPQREANLGARLAEYLGLGLEAGIIYAS